MSWWIRKHNDLQRHTGGPTKLVKKPPTIGGKLKDGDLGWKMANPGGFGKIWSIWDCLESCSGQCDCSAEEKKYSGEGQFYFRTFAIIIKILNFRQIKKHKAREYERWFEAEKPWLGSLGVREWVVLPRMTWTFLNLIAARKIQTNWSGVEVWPICKTQTTKALWLFPMNKNEFKWITRNRNRQIMQMKRQPSIHILSKIFDQGEILPTDFDKCTILRLSTQYLTWQGPRLT